MHHQVFDTKSWSLKQATLTLWTTLGGRLQGGFSLASGQAVQISPWQSGGSLIWLDRG